jgi:DNA-binding NarL/FixJ family response regulator
MVDPAPSDFCDDGVKIMKKKIQLNPKLGYMASEFDTHFKVFHELMSKKVLEILLVASPYDAYILEEDGSLAAKIINEYNGLNLSRPPRLTRVEGARKALENLQASAYDLVITMPHLDDMDSFELGLAIKSFKPDLPVILLAHSIHGLHPLPANKDHSGIDEIFIWSGDADLLLAIVKNVEDRLNVDKDTRIAQVRVIILVEDSPLYRSYFLPLIYKEVVHQTQEVLDESLNEEHRLLKMRARPKILVAENFETALGLYERYKPFVFSVVTDTRFPRDGQICADAGVQLLRHIKNEIPDLPLLLLSNEPHNRTLAETIPAQFLDKNSPYLFKSLHQFCLDHLGFGDFVFRQSDAREVGRASNLQQLEALLPTIPEEPLCYHAMRNRFSNWIMARSEIALASHLRQVQASDFPDVASMRQYLIASIHNLRIWRQKGVVSQFNAKVFDSQVTDIVKIGNGSLGGKARGMAFAANLLRQIPQLFEKYSGLDIRIPPTLVITSDGFDAFVTANDLKDPRYEHWGDSQIGNAFSRARIPNPIKKDLETYIKSVRYPLSIRSSSLLEDAHHQPLSGLYETIMIPNNHGNDEVRLQQLLAAIKQVYASTWFETPRRFTRSTAFRHRREQMAVMIQQIAGRSYGDYYYPAISGVARSQNYYSVGRIRPNDGMVKISAGFGRIINRGEGGLRFCPKYPNQIPDFSKIEDILANAQTHFYALQLTPTVESIKSGSDLQRREVSDALTEAPFKSLTSTYFPEDGRLRDTAVGPGQKVVTFAGVLKHNVFPLAEIVTDLLDIGHKGMGCHVEIEFAVDFGAADTQSPTFYLLQMRPMSLGGDPFDVEVTEENRTEALCYSSQTLGHGKYENISDIVYIKPDAFDPARTREMAKEISAVNATFAALRDDVRYLLIGPGRWGSFDPWLGVPVKWEDIDNVGAIIELRDATLKADASQGSHFFQQITTNGIPYLTISQGTKDLIQWDRIRKLHTIAEAAYTCHVRLPKPLQIKCDGRSSQGAILE